ncbi:MAG: N-acetyl-gamma-glutamyl-phosphate reductase [Gemmataceae bacterium]|nr:N-acetyl-gamma-glutamyl-phosphate reductase [Gemmataceae bacterium]MDW8242882.1 N-acetyl-gamma-glutamyl-phosphate reductase [Thermogemmata sp.]
MTKVPVAILGGSGYTAAELLKILLRHPGVEIAMITSRQKESIADLHPFLHCRLNMDCEPFDPDHLQRRGVAAVFSCLPHGASSSCIPPLLQRGIRVIDLSADYRLRDPVIYEQWYHEPHQDPHHLAEAVYGLPEIYGERIAQARLVANPGCYPQTAILGLAPLIAAGCIHRTDIIIDSKSGVSGGGRTPKLTFHFPECNESVSAYGIGVHRHTPEIEQVLSDVAGQKVEVIFTPHLIPMDRGILSTIYVTPTRPLEPLELQELYQRYYQRQPFVRLRSRPPATKDTLHSNFLDIYVQAVRGGRLIIVTAEDNLVRGASGVAVQNFNRMFGFEETTALL